MQDNLVAERSEISAVKIEQKIVFSAYLERDVIVDVYFPSQLLGINNVELLLINDGQDLVKMNFGSILSSLICGGEIQPLLCIGIHCGADRLNEYGTQLRADYMGRGAKAGLYSKFIFDELLPFLQMELKVSFGQKSFAGFSLGALSAMDVVWNNAHEFTRAGVFSGALWWRRRGYEDEKYNWDTDRLMHLQVQKGSYRKGLQFFFECGRLDETADRNGNGIIDSIDDTLDLIKNLKALGYSDENIHYLELADGRHDVETWAKAFPGFLKWGWGSL